MSQSRVPETAYRYFTARGVGVDDVTSYLGHPTIGQVFYPDRGWRRYSSMKRVSASWCRKLRSEYGITHVALDCGGHRADFSIAELVR